MPILNPAIAITFDGEPMKQLDLFYEMSVPARLPKGKSSDDATEAAVARQMEAHKALFGKVIGHLLDAEDALHELISGNVRLGSGWAQRSDLIEHIRHEIEEWA